MARQKTVFVPSQTPAQALIAAFDTSDLPTRIETARLDVTHPETVIQRIETHCGSNDDPHWARVDALMLEALDRQGGPDEKEDARLLRQTTGGGCLETAARHTGFILGVEYCKQLMRAGGVQ